MDQEPSKDFFDASAVNDLETARLALRWARERIHKMAEELSSIKQDKERTDVQAAQLSQEVLQKDEVVKRWKETIKVWEASISDHKKMEALVTFDDDDTGPWMNKLTALEEELATLLGRKIEVVSRKGIARSRNWIRRRAILESATVIYGS